MAYLKSVKEIQTLCSEVFDSISSSNGVERDENTNSGNKILDRGGLRQLFSRRKQRQQKRTTKETQEIGKIRAKMRNLVHVVPNVDPLQHIKTELLLVTAELKNVGPTSDNQDVLKVLNRCLMALDQLSSKIETSSASAATTTPARQPPPPSVFWSSTPRKGFSTPQSQILSDSPGLTRSETHRGVLSSQRTPTSQPPASARASTSRRPYGSGIRHLTPKDAQEQRFRSIEERMERAGLGTPILSASKLASQSSTSKANSSTPFQQGADTPLSCPPPTPTRSPAVRRLMELNSMKKRPKVTSSALEIVLSPKAASESCNSNAGKVSPPVVLLETISSKMRRRSIIEDAQVRVIECDLSPRNGASASPPVVTTTGQSATAHPPPVPVRPAEIPVACESTENKLYDSPSMEEELTDSNTNGEAANSSAENLCDSEGNGSAVEEATIKDINDMENVVERDEPLELVPDVEGSLHSVPQVCCNQEDDAAKVVGVAGPSGARMVPQEQGCGDDVLNTEGDGIDSGNYEAAGTSESQPAELNVEDKLVCATKDLTSVHTEGEFLINPADKHIEAALEQESFATTETEHFPNQIIEKKVPRTSIESKEETAQIVDVDVLPTKMGSDPAIGDDEQSTSQRMQATDGDKATQPDVDGEEIACDDVKSVPTADIETQVVETEAGVDNSDMGLRESNTTPSRSIDQQVTDDKIARDSSPQANTEMVCPGDQDIRSNEIKGSSNSNSGDTESTNGDTLVITQSKCSKDGLSSSPDELDVCSSHDSTHSQLGPKDREGVEIARTVADSRKTSKVDKGTESQDGEAPRVLESSSSLESAGTVKPMQHKILKAALAQERARRQRLDQSATKLTVNTPSVHAATLRAALRDERLRRRGRIGRVKDAHSSDDLFPGDKTLDKQVLDTELEQQRNSNSDRGRLLSHGIRLAASEAAQMPLRELIDHDFQAQVNHTPYLELEPGVSLSYTFRDHCPLVFRTLRTMGGVEDNEYLQSVSSRPLTGGTQGSGKSGAVFFQSADEQFIIKEVKKNERKVLLGILESYFRHLESHPYTFLPRIFGLYTMEAPAPVSQAAITVVVMRNILHCPHPLTLGEDCLGSDRESVEIHEVYDLKGSVDKRFTSGQVAGTDFGEQFTPQPSRRHARTHSLNSIASDLGALGSQGAMGSPGNPNGITRHASMDGGMLPPRLGRRNSAPCVLKDLNLRCKFKLGSQRKRALVAQLDADSKFLEQHNIMDYSLLLGVHSSPLRANEPPTPLSLQSDHGYESPDDLREEVAPGPLASPRNECHAVLRRARDEREQYAALLPMAAEVQVSFHAYANCKRSRESSRFYRPSKKTIYAWQVTRIDGAVEGEPLELPAGECPALVQKRSSFPFDDDPEAAPGSDQQPRSWLIFRRYSDFEKLHKAISEVIHENQSSQHIPALPKKSNFNNLKPEFIEQRARDLECWLQQLLELLGNQGWLFPALADFLTLRANRYPEGWSPEVLGQASLPSSTPRSQVPPTPLPAPPPIAPFHEQEQFSPEVGPMRPLTASSECTTSSSTPGQGAHSCRRKSQMAWDTEELLQDSRLWDEKLGGEKHAWVEAKRVAVGKKSRPSVHLFIGMIDILQEYTVWKKGESFYKGFTQHADGISAVDPSTYRQRFMAYVCESVFKS